MDKIQSKPTDFGGQEINHIVKSNLTSLFDRGQMCSYM